MRDIDIRRTLLNNLRAQHASDDGTIVVEELGLCQGTARVDVAAVNGIIHGFEIKSAHDTLSRLHGQIAVYGKVLTHVTIVAAEQHVGRAFAAVPDWWGISLAEDTSRAVCLTPLRAPSRNPQVDPQSLVQLLWRDEALAALEARGLAGGVRSKPRRAVWDRLAMALPADELILLVRDQLKNRPPDWRESVSRV
jgi:hypothetical protein